MVLMKLFRSPLPPPESLTHFLASLLFSGCCTNVLGVEEQRVCVRERERENIHIHRLEYGNAERSGSGKWHVFMSFRLNVLPPGNWG